MRRFAILTLAFCLALSTAACGKKGPLDKPGKDKDEEKTTALVLPR